MTNKHLSKPLITPEIKQLTDRKSQYFELYRLDVINHAENNSFKNTINSKIKGAKADYYIYIYFLILRTTLSQADPFYLRSRHRVQLKDK